MNYPFTHIAIIYNPNSTGNGPADAKKLQSHLKKQLPTSVKIDLTPTKSAGHAEKLARDYAKSHQKCLIVSASGDGGYNEVVNGVIGTSKTAVVAVLPSGNANDHDRAISDDDILRRIVKADITKIDAIKLTGLKDGKKFERYAHSYIGMGLTAYIGKKLTEADLNPAEREVARAEVLGAFSARDTSDRLRSTLGQVFECRL